jgi:hypothetical protein
LVFIKKSLPQQGERLLGGEKKKEILIQWFNLV